MNIMSLFLVKWRRDATSSTKLSVVYKMLCIQVFADEGVP
jgi:hypothetical protein